MGFVIMLIIIIVDNALFFYRIKVPDLPLLCKTRCNARKFGPGRFGGVMGFFAFSH